MPKCPHCGSHNTSWTNFVEVGAANAVGIAAGALMSMISPTCANMAHYRASRKLIENKEYHCNNCGKNFKKDRMTGTVY